MKKTEYEKGWYDCYKSVRTMLNGTMKDMVALRSPAAENVPQEEPKSAVSGRTRGRPRRSNGGEVRT